jgi:hypothetical protein
VLVEIQRIAAFDLAFTALAVSIARNKKRPDNRTASSALNLLANLKNSKNTSIFSSARQSKNCDFDAPSIG